MEVASHAKPGGFLPAHNLSGLIELFHPGHIRFKSSEHDQSGLNEEAGESTRLELHSKIDLEFFGNGIVNRRDGDLSARPLPTNDFLGLCFGNEHQLVVDLLYREVHFKFLGGSISTHLDFDPPSVFQLGSRSDSLRYPRKRPPLSLATVTKECVRVSDELRIEARASSVIAPIASDVWHAELAS
jgi:hypothetical protein